MGNLVLWNKMRRMQSEMDDMFLNFFETPHSLLSIDKDFDAKMPMLRASADMYETDKEIVAKFDLPGVEKKDIDIEIVNGTLKVKVEKKKEVEEKKKSHYFMERSYSGYYRAVKLPGYAKSDGVKADYKDGVLTVKVPKEENKKVNGKKISVY